MFSRHIRYIFWVLCLVLLATPAQAQTTARAGLTSPQVEAFPFVETYLDVHAADGTFIHDLQLSQITLLEDELPAQEVAIQELRPGAQLVVVVNPGPAIGMRNSRGVSRYELIRQVLEQWSTARLGSTVDDLSLLIAGERETSHIKNPQAWLDTLPPALENARQAVPSLDTLSQAVDMAADPTPRAGMGRAVLWITTPLENSQNLALDDVIARANQQGINIFVWLVSTPEAESTSAAQRLTELATQTGGKFFLYTGQEILPDLESYLEPVRNIYHISYMSRVRQSGSHHLSAVIQSATETISTPPVNYEINLLPPNPAFINPPLEITRQLPEQLTGVAAADVAIEDYSPGELTLQILVDFPDQRMRSLVRTALLVDGTLIDENTSPPFDSFQWDIRSLAESGSHSLQVTAEDILGLNGSSINTIVEVNVQRPANSLWVLLARNTPILLGLAVLLTSAVVLLLLVVGGRIRPRRLPLSRLSRVKSVPAQVSPAPPVDQTPQTWTSRLHWPQRRVKPQAEAYLTALPRDDAPDTLPPLALASPEVTIGSDPQRATVVLNDPSVEGLHARLLRTEGGLFTLIDAGSIAGTWVNYTLLPPEGACLEHNDLIQLGRCSFRFTQTHPAQIRKPVIRSLDRTGIYPKQEETL